MEQSKNINNSLNKAIIYKPKPKRLCPQRKNIKNVSSPSSSSTSNSDSSQIKFDLEISKIKLTNFDNISLEEINKDFLKYEENIEEEEAQEEIWNILNNDSENNFSESNIRNNSKIKRHKNINKFEEKDLEYLNECNIEDLFNELFEGKNK